MIDQSLVHKHVRRLVEAEIPVKGHTRHSKKGKAYNVRSYTRTDWRNASDVKAGDVIVNQNMQEPMFKVDSVHQARDPHYLVFRGSVVDPRYNASFPNGQYSAHKRDMVLIKSSTGKKNVTHDPNKGYTIGDQVFRHGSGMSAIDRQKARTEKAFRKQNKKWEMSNRSPGKRYGWKP